MVSLATALLRLQKGAEGECDAGLPCEASSHIAVLEAE